MNHTLPNYFFLRSILILCFRLCLSLPFRFPTNILYIFLISPMRATCPAPIIFLDVIATGYGLDDQGSRVRFRAGARNFSTDTASRPALGPTQPSIQWIRGALSLGVKRPGREADYSPPSSAEMKECVELYLHSLNTSSWRGAYLSTGKTLPLLSPL